MRPRSLAPQARHATAAPAPADANRYPPRRIAAAAAGADRNGRLARNGKPGQRKVRRSAPRAPAPRTPRQPADSRPPGVLPVSS